MANVYRTQHVSQPRITQRPSLSCYQCARRKLRCSKSIPCSRCVERGIGHTCYREKVQLTGRQRKHKDELEFLQGLLDSISTGQTSWTPQSLVDSLRQRIITLQTGLNPTPPREVEETVEKPTDRPDCPEPGLARSSGRRSEEQDASLSRDELRLPAFNEPDSTRSIITIDDVAWGRQSKRTHAQNKNDISLPPLCSTLPLTPPQSWELPEEAQARSLITFHLDRLCWCHNALHSPTFLAECELYWKRGSCESPLWMALYFAVLSVSAWCLPADLASELFLNANQKTMSATWYSAMLNVLYSQNFIGQHSIYAVQAIVISNLVVYVLGHSDLQTTLIATAIRIAQCMGLDKQANPDKCGEEQRAGDEVEWKDKVNAELNRRVWWQLIIQDYFEIAFANNFIVHPERFWTGMPLNCDDHDLNEKPLSEPTVSSYCIAISKIACLMPSLVDGINYHKNSSPTELRYQRVLEIDLKMRDLVSSFPSFLKRGEPEQAHWPPWIHWARSTLTISAADKIIMIHRSFLIKSFREPLYAYTRITCLSAALTILKEYEKIKSSEVTSIWVVPAFTIGAAIVVMLDLLHKSDLDPSDQVRRELVEDTVAGLEVDRHNFMAMRGVKLLRALLKEQRELRAAQAQQSHRHENSRSGSQRLVEHEMHDSNEAEPYSDEVEAWFEGNIPYYSSSALELPAFKDVYTSFLSS